MKFFRLGLLLSVVAFISAAGCSVAPPKILPLEQHKPDLPYALPFCDLAYYVVLQGQNGSFSHNGRHAYAIDFSMPEGTPVCAARAGRVVAVKEDSNSGGNTIEYADQGNRVVVEHADGTRATYLHLEQNGALVDTGKCVARGQQIGLSGNTGWSTRPHLHFVVQAIDPAQTGQGWWSVPVVFDTESGPRKKFWFGRRTRHPGNPEIGEKPDCYGAPQQPFRPISPPPGKEYRQQQ